MKKFQNILTVLLLGLMLAGCKPRATLPPMVESDVSQPSGHIHPGSDEKKILYYTCSMHPFIKKDQPGRCPICGMDLVPVFSESISPTESQPADAPGAFQVGPERQQLIGMKSEAVTRGPLVREIEAMGRVAYDPDLYVAQSDYLLARRTGGGGLDGLQGGLVRSSRSRLLLLGMSEAQIRELERSGKSQSGLVLPQKGSGIWVYGSIFETDLPWVKVGDAVEVRVPGSATSYSSEVASLDPTIDPATRSATLRVRLSNPTQELRPNMFLKLTIRGEGGSALLIPATAILATGKRDLVYLDRGAGRFAAVEVKIGRRGSNGVEILEGLQEGDKVVTQGNFLLDSEASLQGAAVGGHHH